MLQKGSNFKVFFFQGPPGPPGIKVNFVLKNERTHIKGKNSDYLCLLKLAALSFWAAKFLHIK